MNVELDDGMIDSLISDSLCDSHKTLTEYINGGRDTRMPMYHHNEEKDLKRVTKLVKALRLVHNYYTPHVDHL
jgi:hypothetical protein